MLLNSPMFDFKVRPRCFPITLEIQSCEPPPPPPPATRPNRLFRKQEVEKISLDYPFKMYSTYLITVSKLHTVICKQWLVLEYILSSYFCKYKIFTEINKGTFFYKTS
jgi:hypothetical protein